MITSSQTLYSINSPYFFWTCGGKSIFLEQERIYSFYPSALAIAPRKKSASLDSIKHINNIRNIINDAIVGTVRNLFKNNDALNIIKNQYPLCNLSFT